MYKLPKKQLHRVYNKNKLITKVGVPVIYRLYSSKVCCRVYNNLQLSLTEPKTYTEFGTKLNVYAWVVTKYRLDTVGKEYYSIPLRHRTISKGSGKFFNSKYYLPEQGYRKINEKKIS
jgi:hypothetical protein